MGQGPACLLYTSVQIPQDATGGARDGQLVVVELTQAPDARRPPIGKVIAVLGDSLTPSLVVEAAIHGHNLPHEFPQEVLDEATAVPLVVEPSMIGDRVDLRSMPLVTIDGADAKDFDDAVYCAVSYTHLDVYKRQRWPCARSRSG